MTEKVTIERAAIWIGSTIYSLPRPNRHHNIMWWLSNLGITSGQMHEQGFVDSRGYYQNREHAAALALAAGQVEKLISPPLLYSEDLWDGGADLPSYAAIQALASPAEESAVYPEWLPIKTAPFDPEWSVLGWEPGMDAAVEMAWRADMKRWITRGGGEISPTVWQTLPTPPASAEARSEQAEGEA